MSEYPRLTRRRLLRLAPLGGLTLAAGCSSPLAGFFDAMDGWNNQVQRRLFRPSALAPELAAGSETRPDAFPKYLIGDGYPIAGAGWELAVTGLVAKPQRFSLADLQRFPRVDMRVRHHCVEGWSAVAGWHGVRVSDLARAAGVLPSATCVDFQSFELDPQTGEAYRSSWDAESALHPQSLVAYGMNGTPLRTEHGGPVRLYGAVKLGYKSVKWLREIRFTSEPTGGYWESRGYEWFAGV